MIEKIFYSLLVVISCIASGGCEKQEVAVQAVPNLQNLVMETDVSITGIEEEFPILFLYNGLYGYLDRQLKVIIPPIYDRGINYTEYGYAWGRLQKKGNEFGCVIFDRKGEIVFRDNTAGMSILYDDVISYRSEDDGLYKVVKFRDNIVIMDRLGGAATSSEDGIILARLFDTNEWIFFDSSGKRILPGLELRRMSRSFQEERAVVVLGENWDIVIIDISGNVYGDLHFFRIGRNFFEGLLPAETTDGCTGYINRDGEFAFIVPIVAEIQDYDESLLNATDFKAGYALIQTILDPPIWRVINNHGEFVSDELPLSWAGAFNDELSCVRVNNEKYGFINIKGEMVINPIFDYADSFYQGYARILYQGRDGIINAEGKIFWSDEIINSQKPASTYVFNIDSFKYLDEFPRTIDGIKGMYPNEPFEEKVSERFGKSVLIGDYIYSLDSPNIQFDFWGDTTEDAVLFAVEIFNSDYQCKNIQVISMSAEEIEFVSNRKLNLDKNIMIYTESDDGLIIRTKDGIVINYLIVGM